MQENFKNRRNPFTGHWLIPAAVKREGLSGNDSLDAGIDQ
jgi:hypothetical protein